MLWIPTTSIPITAIYINTKGHTDKKFIVNDDRCGKNKHSKTYTRKPTNQVFVVCFFSCRRKTILLRPKTIDAVLVTRRGSPSLSSRNRIKPVKKALYSCSKSDKDVMGFASAIQWMSTNKAVKGAYIKRPSGR